MNRKDLRKIKSNHIFSRKPINLFMANWLGVGHNLSMLIIITFVLYFLYLAVSNNNLMSLTIGFLLNFAAYFTNRYWRVRKERAFVEQEGLDIPKKMRSKVFSFKNFKKSEAVIQDAVFYKNMSDKEIEAKIDKIQQGLYDRKLDLTTYIVSTGIVIIVLINNGITQKLTTNVLLNNAFQLALPVIGFIILVLAIRDVILLSELRDVRNTLKNILVNRTYLRQIKTQQISISVKVSQIRREISEWKVLLDN